MVNRRGGLSVFRIAVIGAIIGAVLIIGGIITLNTDQNSRRNPLIIDPYPGAELWGSPINDSQTNVRFSMRVRNVSPEDVLSYYQNELIEFAASERCVRIPASGSLPVDPGISNSVPYRYDCMFDRSSRNATQYTRVTIFPETEAMDPSNSDGTNNTIINYQQVWQP